VLIIWICIYIYWQITILWSWENVYESGLLKSEAFFTQNPLSLKYNLHENLSFSAICVVFGTANEPCCLQVRISKTLGATLNTGIHWTSPGWMYFPFQCFVVKSTSQEYSMMEGLSCVAFWPQCNTSDHRSDFLDNEQSFTSTKICH
jgi:hypothetical protein